MMLVYIFTPKPVFKLYGFTSLNKLFLFKNITF
jgi:hypothetical protein